MTRSRISHSTSVARPFLSLVMPVHNGAAFIERNVDAVLDALGRLEAPIEVIVVSDGCRDRTADIVRGIPDPRVTLVEYPDNQGKGHAILHGMAAAGGRLIGFLDADLDIDAHVIVDAVRRFEAQPVDAVIGSKRHGDSTVRYPVVRRVYSAGFQLLVRLLFRINVRDTQVGAKVFRREMIETVAPLVLVKRYAFDLEVLAVGAEFGFDRIEEVPIDLRYRFSGTGINWRAVRRMMLDTLAIAYRIHLRHTYVRRFASLQRHRMDEADRHDKLLAEALAQGMAVPLAAGEEPGALAPEARGRTAV
jgi:glycosyltransferase involved in cell wall biosynthesis